MYILSVCSRIVERFTCFVCFYTYSAIFKNLNMCCVHSNLYQWPRKTEFSKINKFMQSTSMDPVLIRFGVNANIKHFNWLNGFSWLCIDTWSRCTMNIGFSMWFLDICTWLIRNLMEILIKYSIIHHLTEHH